MASPHPSSPILPHFVIKQLKREAPWPAVKILKRWYSMHYVPSIHT